MRKAYLCAATSLLLFALSCNNNESNPEEIVETSTPNPTEKIALNPNDVSGSRN